MKYFVSTLAIVSSLALAAPAVAADNQADCEAAGGVWNADTNTCTK